MLGTRPVDDVVPARSGPNGGHRAHAGVLACAQRCRREERPTPLPLVDSTAAHTRALARFWLGTT